jgi:uncharacterized protein
MKTAWTAAVAAVAFLAVSPGAGAQDVPRQLSVTGHAEIPVSVDVARIFLGVEAQDSEAAAALDAASERLRQVNARLDARGIPQAQRQTTGLSLSPIYTWEEKDGTNVQKTTGFTAQNMLVITLTDIAEAGALIDEVVKAGANNISGINFDVADKAAAADEARRAAVADARAKAELYADAAGVGLGEILSISELNVGVPGPMRMDMRMAEAAAPVPVSPGQIEVSADVTLVYRIGEAP